MKKRRVVSLVAAASLLMVNGAYAAIPGNTVILGDKAYHIDLLFEDSYNAQIQTALAEAGDALYYDFNDEGFRTIFGNQFVTDAEKTQWPEISRLDEHGIETRYEASTQKPIGDAELAVESVSAINETTIQATLVTDENVTEENLTEKTLTVATGETTFTATYEAGSLVDSKANFILTGSDVLVDATTYTVSGDDFEFTNDTFVAMIADEYIADFEFNTTGLPNLADAKVYFTVKNQYGEEISDFDALDNNLEVTGTMGTFPLTVLVANDGTGVITISDTLVTDKNVSLTLVNKDAESNIIATKTFTATVQEVTLTPTAISSIEIANATQTAGTANITLTAKVVDQFGNDIALNADSTSRAIRWTIDDTSILEFHGEDNTVTVKDGAADSKTISIDTIASGTATVKAYLPDGTEVTTPLVVTVTNGDLNSIVTTNATLTVANKATVTDSNITINGTTGTRINFQNALGNDIALNADTVSFTVVDSASKDASSEVSIVKVPDENGNLSGLKVTTSRADQDTATVANNPNEVYTVTIAVGETTSTFNVTSQIDTAVTSIDAISIGAEELTAGGNVVKPIAFRNQYNEMVEVTDNSTDDVLTFSSPTGITLAAAKDDAGALAGDGEAITHIKFAAGGSVAADTYNTVVAKEGAIRQVSVPVVAAAELTTVEIANSVTVINNDTAALEDNDLHVVDTEAYVLLPVTFKDQYGNAIDVAANSSDLAVEGDTANYVYKFFKAGDDDSQRTSIIDTTAIAYVGFAAKSLTDGNLPAVHEIKLTNGLAGEDKVTFATISVTANKSRALEALSVDPTSGNAVVGAAKLFTLSGVDQYGVAVDLDESNVQLETLANVTIGNRAANAEDTNKANFTLTADVEGSYTAKVFYSADTTLDPGEKSINIPFTAGELGAAIEYIEIQPTVTVNPDNSGGGNVYETNLDTYKAEITENASSDYTFTVKAYDAASNEVAINTSDIFLTVLDNSLEEASAGLNTSVTDTTLTVTSTDAANDDEVSGTLTVRAIVNGKIDDMLLTFDSSASAAQDGTHYLGSTFDATEALTEITLDVNDANGQESVYIVAKDQFGKIFDVDETAILGVSQDSSAYSTVTQADPITVTAKAVGSTTLRVLVDANDTIVIPVSVDQDAVDALPQSVAFATTVPTAHGVAPIQQVETATTVALDVIDVSGDYNVTVTAADGGNLASGKTINVAVLAGDDADAVADKVRTALNSDGDVTNWFAVSGTGSDIVLTANTAAADDATANLSLADVGSSATTSNGGGGSALTPVPTSDNTIAGVAEVKEVATTTVTTGANQTGTISVNVADGSINVNVTVNVTAGMTAAEVADAVRVALAADGTVNAAYDVTGAGDDIVLTQTATGADVDLFITLN